MFFFRVFFLFALSLTGQLIFAEGALAWGPAIHTVIASRILGEVGQILPVIAAAIRAFPFEYLYGSLAADFFVGKGLKQKDGHSHNWDSGLRFLGDAKDERERAYAYGFISHLAADVVAHNYFVPSLLHQGSTWKRAGHIYWEAKADYVVGPVYMRIAREILSMDRLGCDDLLMTAVGKRKQGLKARRHIFTQSVKLSDYLHGSPSVSMVNKGTRYQISPAYLAFMINLAYRLVRDLLTRPGSSPCMSYDPIGARNLYLASRHAVLSRLFDFPRPVYRFKVDQELLDI
jgi:hypothetical protein